MVNENTSMDRYSDQYVNLAYDKIEQNIIDSICLVKQYFYKEKYSFDKAFSIIEESLGKHFDAELGKIFIKQRTALEAYYESVQQSECEE